MKVRIFTDGAAVDYGKPTCVGSWAYVVLNQQNHIMKEDSGIITPSSSNISEMKAILEALEYCETQNFEDILICSDSSYCVSGINNWNLWQKAFTPKEMANRTLWQNMAHYKETMEWRIKWVKGHAGNEWNEYVDMMCNSLLST